jgi:hypothetical protein
MFTPGDFILNFVAAGLNSYFPKIGSADIQFSENVIHQLYIGHGKEFPRDMPKTFASTTKTIDKDWF